MAEIAIVSSRKTKLRQLAQSGDSNAAAALGLAQSPNRFLSTVQIGITFVGVFAGAFGGERIADDLAKFFSTIPLIADYNQGLALLTVVLVITYLSLIIGELVPKRLALNSPEKVASLIARPMKTFSSIVWPLVTFLTTSTDWLMDRLGIKQKVDPSVSEEEIKMMIREGAQIGVFNVTETDIVERTFKLSDTKAKSIMTPNRGITWLDVNDNEEALKKKISGNPHTHFPVYKTDKNHILGIIRAEDLLTNFLVEERIDLVKFLHKPLVVNEEVDVFKLLELFKKSGVHASLITDKKNKVVGIISLTDVLEGIVGDIPTFEEIALRQKNLNAK